VAARYLAYAKRELDRDARLGELVRPLLGLYRGVPGARRWRRTLGELAHRRDATIEDVARGCAILTSRAGAGSEPIAERAGAGSTAGLAA
jgi:tRNA-dihydrouridine synthase A